MLRSLKAAMAVSRWHFYQWRNTPKIMTVFVALTAFVLCHTQGLVHLSSELEITLSPWIFPHLLTPVVLVFVSFMTAMLFCDAPFADQELYYIITRIGRPCWVLAQILYILLAALVYTLFFCLISVLALIPHVSFTSDWGVILRTLSENPSLATVRGITDAMTIDKEILSQFTPAAAMGISIFLFWLNSVFIGVLIMCFNMAFHHMCGVAVSTFFSVLSYFSLYQGRFTIGTWLYYISPYNWCSMLYLNFGYVAAGGPTFGWAVSMQTGVILLLCGLCFYLTVHRDIDRLGG